MGFESRPVLSSDIDNNAAERHGLNPQQYLQSVLAKIGQTPMSELEQFLPEVWKAEDAAEARPVSAAVSS